MESTILTVRPLYPIQSKQSHPSIGLVSCALCQSPIRSGARTQAWFILIAHGKQNDWYLVRHTGFQPDPLPATTYPRLLRFGMDVVCTYICR